MSPKEIRRGSLWMSRDGNGVYILSLVERKGNSHYMAMISLNGERLTEPVFVRNVDNITKNELNRLQAVNILGEGTFRKLNKGEIKISFDNSGVFNMEILPNSQPNTIPKNKLPVVRRKK